MEEKVSFGKSLMSGTVGGFVAAAVNSSLFFVFHALGVITDEVVIPPANEPMTVVPVVMASLVPAILSTVVYWLLCQFTANGYRIFQIVALILLIVSYVNPFMSIPGITFGYGLAINLLHTVVVVSLLYFYRKYAYPVGSSDAPG